MVDIIETFGKVPGKDMIAVIVIFFISLHLFANFIQPVLISIDPMFAGSGSDSSDGRFATGPVGLALFGTCMVLLTLYFMVLQPKVVSYFSDEE